MERVVLNALAESLRLHQLIHICACGGRLPSVRAGLAFSGEADPPLTQRTGGTVAAATPQIVDKVTAAYCLKYILRLRRPICHRPEPDWHFQEKPIHLVTAPSRTAMSLGVP